MSDGSVPAIDIEPFRRGTPAGKGAVARQVAAASCEFGFFTVLGHDVPEALTRRTRAQAAAFFALPPDEKARSEPPASKKVPRGFSPLGNRSLSYTREVEAPPDLQESFAIGQLDAPAPPPGANPVVAGFFAPNIWPAEPPGFEATMSDYFRAMGELADTIMRIFAVALDVDEAYFADKIDRHPSVVRLTYYPPQPESPLPGQVRSGEHIDYGSLTILRGDDVPGGLQVRRRDGAWTEVHPDPAAFICNLGDMMMRWTNDHWTSTPHRVVNPPREFASQGRISLVFFHMPNHDAVIRCIDGRAEATAEKYPPITCSEYLASKFLRSELQRLDVDLASGAPANG